MREPALNVTNPKRIVYSSLPRVTLLGEIDLNELSKLEVTLKMDYIGHDPLRYQLDLYDHEKLECFIQVASQHFSEPHYEIKTTILNLIDQIEQYRYSHG